MRSFTSRLPVVLLCGLASVASAGTVIQTATRELPTGTQSATTTLYVDTGKLRMEQKDAGGNPGDSGLIFKDEKIYALNHKKKTYTVTDRAAAKVIAAKLNATFAQMEEQIEHMEPEQKAMVEAAMGRSNGEKRPPTSFEKTTRSEKAAAKGCRVWEGTRGRDKIIEYCVAPYTAVTGGSEVMAVMKQIMGVMTEISAAISESGMGASPLSTEWEGIEKLDGYPLLTRIFQEDEPVSETVLQSSRSDTVAAQQFEVPAGYTQEQMAGL